MKYLNKYATTAAYTADTNRPTNETTVSLITDGTGVKFDGKNVLVEKAGAEVGDILVFDKTTSTKKFVKATTLNVATLPASLVTIGVVYNRTNSQVYIVAKTNESNQRWAQGYKVKLAGFDLVNGGTFTITVNATTTADVVYPAGTTLAAIVTLISTAINAGVANTALKNWTVAAGADYITIEHNWYTPLITIVTVTDSALKVTAATLTPIDYQKTLTGLLPAYNVTTRVDGSATSWAGGNHEKFRSHYYVNGTTDINQAVGVGNPVKYAVYNSTDNPILIGFYGAGEDGYTKYIAAKMAKMPYGKNANQDFDGKINTDKLAAVTFVDADGTTQPAFPAAYKAKNTAVGTVAGFNTGLESGSWWMPAFRELFELVRDRKGDASDQLNKSLAAIGGHIILPTHYLWASTETGSSNAWYYLGNYGDLYYFGKYYSYRSRAVTAF